jgi:hypothetical protein
MPEYRKLEAREILQVSPESTLDLQRSQDVLSKLVRHTGFNAADGLLLDLSGARCQLSIADVFELASHVAGMQAVHDRKVAVVLPETSEAERAAFGAQIARHRGAHMRLFGTASDAYTWLEE